jgi:branched-chain amino acid transport system permease protein
VEVPEARITLLGAGSDPDVRDALRLAYRVTDHHGTNDRAVTCAFGREGAAADRRTLVGVRDRRGVMSDARFYMLKRFWLDDPNTFSQALARVEIAPGAVPRGLVTLPKGPAVVLQSLVDAAAPASLYALLALACSLIWGLVGRVNFAFGDVAMLGAYGALIGALLAGGAGIAAAGPLIVLAVAMALFVGATRGGVLGRVVFAPLAFRSAQPLLIATVGLSIALQEFVARSQGARDRFLAPLLDEPRLLADGPFTVMVTPMRLVVVGVTLAAVGAALAIFPRTRFGRAWAAVADDAVMARLLGLDPTRVLIVTFALASSLAALSGAVLTLAYGGTSFHMGTILGLKAVVAAVIGGIGSLPGAALGGLLLGLAEAVWSAAFGIEWRDAAILSLLAVFLIFRPAGLLGRDDPAARHDRGDRA